MLRLPATDMLGFSWLKSVESLCGDRFSNPFKDVRQVGTNCAPGSPTPIESEDSGNGGESMSNTTSDAKVFLCLVRLVYISLNVDLPSFRCAY